MCGRYASTRSAADLSALFEAFDETEPIGAVPRYNVAPTDTMPLVRVSGRRRERVLSLGQWGLFGSARMINARAETVATARAHAAAFAQRRALVPADGWYEWRRDGAGRQAYFLAPADGSVLALAGLWTATRQGLTFTVVTTAAAGELAQVHDRMPLVLPAARWRAWLTEPAERVAPLLDAAEVPAGMEIRPVGPAVGNVRNDGPELVDRVDPAGPDRLW